MIYIPLDKSQKRSYTHQIYNYIRDMILSGELAEGEALPSSRELSKNLSVAKNTVLNAYDMLVSEGAVYSITGSGYYVSSGAINKKSPVNVQSKQTTSLTDLSISDYIINFDSGLPALDLFPREKWNRAVSHAFIDAPTSALGYDDPQGRSELRTVLCTYLKKTRGITCSPDQIIITAGAKQGLTLTAKCLLSAESEVWLEDPSNANVRKIFSYHTNKIFPCRVDDQGICTNELPLDGKPDLIFVTPSHQFPMGGILPLQRRIELVEFARKSGAYLVEDDYDSSFSYHSQPIHSLFELDDCHVIYIGTFSKVLFPSIRLGYLVVPEHLVRKIRALKRLSDHHSNSIYQLALMNIIEAGVLDRHIRRMKKEYHKRRDLLINLLQESFGDHIRIHGSAAGMHIVAEFDNLEFTERHIETLLKAGVYVVPVERHALVKGNHTNQIILGYAGLTEADMRRGLDQIKKICV